MLNIELLLIKHSLCQIRCDMEMLANNKNCSFLMNNFALSQISRDIECETDFGYCV